MISIEKKRKQNNLLFTMYMRKKDYLLCTWLQLLVLILRTFYFIEMKMKKVDNMKQNVDDKRKRKFNVNEINTSTET